MKKITWLSLILVLACTSEESKVESTQEESIEGIVEMNSEILPHLFEVDKSEMIMSLEVKQVMDQLTMRIIDFKKQESKSEFDKQKIRDQYQKVIETVSKSTESSQAFLMDYIHPLEDQIEQYLSEPNSKKYGNLSQYLRGFNQLFSLKAKQED